jgi:pyruvate/2-oxoglutarate dehydrogenase complex dihydrolipoamide dehydrogenase (E3) component
MINTEQYDAIVIGTGQGGKPLALALGEAGWKTAVIERGYIGGTCINYGCTPTKTMVASARVSYLARRGEEYGVHSGEVTVNLREVRRRKQDIVESFRNGGLRRIERTPNLQLIRGTASFVSSNTIEVKAPASGPRRLTAPKVVINTGGRPASPAFPGLESVAPLDSTSIMELDRLPEHLLVVGGGYIGLEFAQMFRRFGSRVTVIQKGAHVLTREDPDVAEEVERILVEDGIELLLNSQPVRALRDDANTIALTVRTDNGEQILIGSHLLMAVGRSPNTEELNLPAAGVEVGPRGTIKVNSKLETNVPGIYAIGDVNGGPQFTHISYDDFRILRTNLLEGGNATTEGRLVPYTVFIDPQLGRVGLTQTEAIEKGLKIRVAKIPMSFVARAIEMGETRGFMKAIVDETTDQILGCAVLGVEGGELMAMLEIAMMGKLPYGKLKEGIFAHPTLAEGLNTLFMTMDSK